jgi:hypothetical protein
MTERPIVLQEDHYDGETCIRTPRAAVAAVQRAFGEPSTHWAATPHRDGFVVARRHKLPGLPEIFRAGGDVYFVSADGDVRDFLPIDPADGWPDTSRTLRVRYRDV